jgi:hypothetical protein
MDSDVRVAAQGRTMTWYLRDWKMLQSYKRKRPSWIKLPLELLYDPRWRRITDRQARALCDDVDDCRRMRHFEGELPPLDQLSAKLRAAHVLLTHNSLSNLIRQLSQRGFLTISSPGAKVRRWPEREFRVEGRIRRGWYFPSPIPTEQDLRAGNGGAVA